MTIEPSGLIITEVDCQYCNSRAIRDGQLSNEQLRTGVKRSVSMSHEKCLDLALALVMFPYELRLKWYRAGWPQPQGTESMQ
jgi:hypothetical protein